MEKLFKKIILGGRAIVLDPRETHLYYDPNGVVLKVEDADDKKERSAADRLDEKMSADEKPAKKAPAKKSAAAPKAKKSAPKKKASSR